MSTIIGSFGAGKSTLLRWINHLETIDSWTIYTKGEPICRFMRKGKPVVDTRRIDESRSQVGRCSTQRSPAQSLMSTSLLAPRETAVESVMARPQSHGGRKV